MGRERERRVYHRYAVHIGIADNYKAINAAAQMDAPDSIRSFYKTLVALRKKMPVISAGKIEFLYPDNADLLAYSLGTTARRSCWFSATCGSGNCQAPARRLDRCRETAG